MLLVEDDETIGRHLHAGLTAHGYHATWALTGASARAHTLRATPDVVLLDLGLPDLDGVDLARDLRARHPNLLIVILTARDDDMDVIIGLDAGADDYLTKPFRLTVLLARLRAHLRSRPAPPADTAALEVGNLRIDPTTRRCHLHGREIPLRPKEFDLLTALAARPGAAVTREDLMAQVWDENWYGSTKTLDVTMAALRQRLTAASTDAQSAPVITTLRGHGYRLEPHPPTHPADSAATDPTPGRPSG